MTLTNEESAIIVNILRQIPLTADLNADDHKEILDRITLEYYPKNHVVFKEGDAGDAFYIIKRGMIRIFHEKNPEREEEVSVAMLGDNDFFGEMALISEKPRNSTCQTVEESEVFKLTKDDFINLVSTNPNMASRISSEFLHRLKTNLRKENP